MIDIAQQLEGVLKFLGERTVRVDGVVARTEHDDILGLEFADSITESVALTRSTRGVSRRVEPEQHVLACECRQLHAAAVMRGDLEVGSEGANR
jgi:hypothetical protein